ncbi:MAG: hypothetical protein F4Y44_02550 [Chloroflexi bacterium]|nr:hypothetical protein [Chloroflexota bacterium]
MTMLNTTEDLLRAARENTEFREAFRQEILTDELLHLPARFTEYSASTDRKIAALTDAVGALTSNMAEYQKTTNERLDRMEEAILETRSELRETRSELSKDIRSLHGMYSQQHDDYERFRGAYSENSARKDDSLIAANIARVRGNWVLMSTRLSRNEMSEIFREAVERDLLDGIDDESQDRFVNADDALVVTERGRAQSQFYLVIEASHTAERNDLVRVANHAKVIERVKGVPAYGVVAGVRIGRDMPSDLLFEDIAQFVRERNPDAAFWHPLRRQFMDPMTDPQ